MNFVAIDFETANEKRNSPCSLGITVVENSQIIEERYWLIKPPELRFNNMNVMIHGITPKDVENEKEFNELWEEIKPYLDNKTVVAHNASFDISVLRKTLDTYGIEYPTFNYICTMVMSRNFYRHLDNSKLNTVNTFLGYEFDHHNAAADARACANILINISEEIKEKDIEIIAKTIGVKVGRVFERDYTSAGILKGNFITSKRSSIKNQKIFGTYENTNETPFKNSVVVFTGPLTTMGRGEAMQLVRKLGGKTGGTVTKQTTMLVVGGKRPELTDMGNMTTKMRRAYSLKELGQEITIINEKEFLTLIKS